MVSSLVSQTRDVSTYFPFSRGYHVDPRVPNQYHSFHETTRPFFVSSSAYLVLLCFPFFLVALPHPDSGDTARLDFTGKTYELALSKVT